jgi:hypothetical protein
MSRILRRLNPFSRKNHETDAKTRRWSLSFTPVSNALERRLLLSITYQQSIVSADLSLNSVGGTYGNEITQPNNYYISNISDSSSDSVIQPSTGQTGSYSVSLNSDIPDKNSDSGNVNLTGDVSKSSGITSYQGTEFNEEYIVIGSANIAGVLSIDFDVSESSSGEGVTSAEFRESINLAGGGYQSNPGIYNFNVKQGDSYEIDIFNSGGANDNPLDATTPGGDAQSSVTLSWSLVPLQSPSKTSISSSSNPSLASQPVTLTATVSPATSGLPTPTGTVTFRDGKTVLNPGGSQLNASGTATFTTSMLAAGTHSITAVYGGDSTFSGSTSSPVSQTVTAPPATQLAITTQPPPVVGLNSPFDVKVVAEDANGNPVPGFSGPVTLALDNNPSNATLGGTLTVNAINGVADFSDLTLNKVGPLQTNSPGYTLQATATGLPPIDTDALTVAYTPEQIRKAYGFDQIPFLESSTDPNYYNENAGQGQTIAILAIGDYSLLYNDISEYDNVFGLPYPPNLIKIGEDGGSFASDLPPSNDGSADAKEEVMDVEWAHALAPQAKIVVVECNSDILDGIPAAVYYPGVSVVSMSFGDYNINGIQQDVNYENLYHEFNSPPGRNITFVASSGDNGNSISYPAISPNVLSVGGTLLSTNPDGSYASEIGASFSGGGSSTLEPEPPYQEGVQSTGLRTFPDVAFDADAQSALAVYISNGPTSSSWTIGSGTSIGAPCWAALIALADQERVNVYGGGNTLDGASQTLPTLYKLSPVDFNKPTDFSGLLILPPYIANNMTTSSGLTSYNNYNENTGLGTPKANLIVPALALLPTATVSLSPSSLPAGTVGVPYTQIITASGGTGDKTFSYVITSNIRPTDLGLTFDEETNVFNITGTPNTAGTITFSVTATDSVGVSTTQSYTLTINPINVTSQVSVTSSGLVYNRATQLFGGTITITNTGTTSLIGTLQFELTGLPAGVTWANAIGIAADGNPFININLPNGILGPGQSFTFSVYFKDPNYISFTYGILVLDEDASS